MSMSKLIAPHLPYLRRFSRALSGSQAAGDAYAVATLEAIVADPAMFKADQDARAELYRIFLRVWGAVDVNKSGSRPVVDVDDAFSRRNLEALTPRSRVAFVLSAVEDFSIEQIAHALECSTEDASSLITKSGQEIAAQITSNVLIIEDEPFIAMDLQGLVEDLGHKVVGMARTHAEATAAALKNRPDLILADIQLADGSSGIDAVKEILGAFEVPVIFITAYPERLLTGARPEPTFLISKPFRTETVKAVISQALFFDQRSRVPAQAAAS